MGSSVSWREQGFALERAEHLSPGAERPATPLASGTPDL